MAVKPIVQDGVVADLAFAPTRKIAHLSRTVSVVGLLGGASGARGCWKRKPAVVEINRRERHGRIAIKGCEEIRDLLTAVYGCWRTWNWGGGAPVVVARGLARLSVVWGA